jgi:hypothetical protein
MIRKAAPQTRFWRRPLVVAFASYFGLSFVVLGLGAAVTANRIGHLAAGLASAFLGGCFLAAAFAHVTASENGISIVYVRTVRHWDWSLISNVTVTNTCACEANLVERIVYATWTPTITLASGEQVPLDILSKGFEGPAQKVVGSLRALAPSRLVHQPQPRFGDVL